MTRGNQREIDRQRAAARHGEQKQAKAGDPNARREADAKALADKIAKKKALQEAQAGGAPAIAEPKGGGNKKS